LMECVNVHGDVAGSFDLTCAWCGQVIGGSGIKNSHGMCEDCYRRELKGQRPHGGGPVNSTPGDGLEQGEGDIVEPGGEG
jgi:hypothetical protein